MSVLSKSVIPFEGIVLSSVFIKQQWSTITVLLGSPLVGCYGDRGGGLGFELENLFRAYTGLASARGFLIEEVSGPHSLE
jgi:hypothetical protein